MSIPPLATAIEPRALPVTTTCAECGVGVTQPFGWCSLCAEAYCRPCGRRHLCTPVCEQNGCAAGYCVRLVTQGTISKSWGLPLDD